MLFLSLCSYFSEGVDTFARHCIYIHSGAILFIWLLLEQSLKKKSTPMYQMSHCFGLLIKVSMVLPNDMLLKLGVTHRCCSWFFPTIHYQEYRNSMSWSTLFWFLEREWLFSSCRISVVLKLYTQIYSFSVMLNQKKWHTTIVNKCCNADSKIKDGIISRL